MPSAPVHTKDAEIIENKELSPGIFRMSFQSQDLASRAQPGQFLQVKVGDCDRQILRRPFSVMDVPDGQGSSTVVIAYKVVGEGTLKLSKMLPGSLLDILGPLGNGFTLGDQQRTLMVAGGIGIAPLIFLARSLNPDIKKSLLFGARTKQQFAGFENTVTLFDETVHTTDDGSFGYEGDLVAHLPSIIKDHSPEIIYACGPESVLEKLSAIAKQAGVPCEIALERRMACGFGVCLSCVCRTKDGMKLTCKHGPVFAAEDIFFDTEGETP